MSDDSPSQPRRTLKKGISADDARRRRTVAVSTIRKNKRVENLRKRRSAATSASAAAEVGSSALGGGGGPVVAADVGDLPALCAALQNNSDRAGQTQAAERIRRMLSREKDPPAKPVIDAGILPWLKETLLAHDAPQLQLEAAWALTNVASTDYTQHVVDCGAVLPLTQLLRSKSADVREQCIWCLGNIAGDGAALRDVVLATPDVVAGLRANLHSAASMSLLRNATWAASNFCRGKPPPPLAAIAPLIPDMVTCTGCEDREVMIDACWALSYASDGGEEFIASILQCDAVPRLIQLMVSYGGMAAAGGDPHSEAVMTPVLRTLGNIVTGTDHQTQAAVEVGIVPALCAVLRHPKKTIRKEACWALSNIAAGTLDQIVALLSVPGIVEEVKRIVVEDVSPVSTEAIWIIANLCTGGEADVVRHVVQSEVVELMCAQLHEQNRRNAKVIEAALDAISSMLTKSGAVPGDVATKHAHEENIVTRIEECGGIELIEQLQQHEEQSIYEKASKIIEKWFSAETDDEESDGGGAMGGAPLAMGGAGSFSLSAAFGAGAAAASPPAAPPAAFGGSSFSFS